MRRLWPILACPPPVALLMLDSIVGSTVDTLKSTGQYYTSIIVLAGDHGAPQNEPDYE